MSVIPTQDRDDPDFDQEALLNMLSTLTKGPVDPATLTGPMLIAYRRLLVRGIRSPYFPHDEMHVTFEEMRTAAPLLRLSGMPQPGVRILAPSYCGKSVGARDYVKKVQERPGCSTYSVVYVKLDSEGSIGSLATDILRALGEKRPESLTAENRWARAKRCLFKYGVDLLILDEFQRAGRRVTIHPVILGKILDIMDGDGITGGYCAVAFVGKTEAKAIFKATSDMGNRLDSPVKLGRLRWTTHSEEFMEFAAHFDQRLVDLKITADLAGLGDPSIAEPLLEAANGTIGQFSRIVETAVVAITRADRGRITRQDLSNAVQDWSIGNERITKNPFTIADDRATRLPAGSTRQADGLAPLGNGSVLDSSRGDGQERIHEDLAPRDQFDDGEYEAEEELEEEGEFGEEEDD